MMLELATTVNCVAVGSACPYTISLLSAIPDTPPVPTLFWISFDMQDGQTIDPIFLERLGRTWQKHCTEFFGVPSYDQEMQDIEGFWNAQNLGGI